MGVARRGTVKLRGEACSVARQGFSELQGTRAALARPTNTNNASISSFSTRDNSTSIDKALAELKLHEPGDGFEHKKLAENHGVNRSTLGRRCKGRTGPRSDGYASQQLLTPQQE